MLFFVICPNVIMEGRPDPDQEPVPSPSSLRRRGKTPHEPQKAFKGHGKKPRERQFRERSPLHGRLGVCVHLFCLFYTPEQHFFFFNSRISSWIKIGEPEHLEETSRCSGRSNAHYWPEFLSWLFNCNLSCYYFCYAQMWLWKAVQTQIMGVYMHLFWDVCFTHLSNIFFFFFNSRTSS